MQTTHAPAAEAGMTAVELASRLRVPLSTIYHWNLMRSRAARLGHPIEKAWGPPAFKVAGKLRYRESDVEAWLAARYAEAV